MRSKKNGKDIGISVLKIDMNQDVVLHTTVETLPSGVTLSQTLMDEINIQQQDLLLLLLLGFMIDLRYVKILILEGIIGMSTIMAGIGNVLPGVTADYLTNRQPDTMRCGSNVPADHLLQTIKDHPDHADHPVMISILDQIPGQTTTTLTRALSIVGVPHDGCSMVAPSRTIESLNVIGILASSALGKILHHLRITIHPGTSAKIGETVKLTNDCLRVHL